MGMSWPPLGRTQVFTHAPRTRCTCRARSPATPADIIRARHGRLLFGCLIHRLCHKARRADDRLFPTTGIRSNAARAHHRPPRAQARRRARLADQGSAGGVSLSRSITLALSPHGRRETRRSLSIMPRSLYMEFFSRARASHFVRAPGMHGNTRQRLHGGMVASNGFVCETNRWVCCCHRHVKQGWF